MKLELVITKKNFRPYVSIEGWILFVWTGCTTKGNIFWLKYVVYQVRRPHIIRYESLITEGAINELREKYQEELNNA